jgi:inhibitor of KinA sporulation pathway (predicted exonuclease)
MIMPKAMEKILVVDVESTCWETEPPIGQSSEITEVGLTAVNILGDQITIGDSFSYLVKPQYSEVSEFCTKLTTITSEVLEKNGRQFAEVCRDLVKLHNSKNYAWASYGDFDRKQFERDCRAKYVGYPFNATHINVKNLFAISKNLKQEVGMSAALAMLGIKLEGTHHRGVDDSRNIAKILAELLKKLRS